MPFGWIKFVDARKQLALRLADPSMIFWTDAELGCYLQESLRTWNALTATWKTTFAFSIAAASAPTWFSLGAMAGSPRLRSLTDSAVYTQMEYHLLEPATGGAWAGTSQFSIADLSLALQRCRDEAIEVANCNQVILSLPTTPGDRVVALPDTVLDVSRVRWMPVSGGNVTLMRNDDTGLSFYQQDYLQATPGVPTQYVLSSTAPLSFHVDIPPAQEGVYEVMALVSGVAFAPPVASPLGVPDDFAFLLKLGALADLLSRESEATDLPRAAYCRKRYSDGLKLLASTPWLMQAQINEVSASTVAVSDLDNYRPEWDSGKADQQTIITAGVDLFTVVPDPQVSLSATLRVLANAPVPLLDGDSLQCSRDVWDAVLDYAQFLAAFKQGGAEFQQAGSLEESFLSAAMATNDRLKNLGLFADVYQQEGTKELRSQERYASEKQ